MADVRLLKLVNGVWELVTSSDDITVNKVTAGSIDIGGDDLAALAPTADQRAALAGTNDLRTITPSSWRPG